jgi:hypothetical protein
MSSLIAEKYANLLTLEDVVWLFELLEKATGNKADAAKICGLERKTTYGWEITKEIRLSTKKKVLAALVENLPQETLDFMAEKSVQASVDILRTYLSALYEKAMTEKDATDFLRLASKFEEKKEKYAGLIADYLEIEVGNMSELFPEKAMELGVVFQPSPIRTVRLSEFSKFLPHVIKTVSMLDPNTPKVEIAKIFNLPSEFVETLSTALREYYIPTGRLIPTEPELRTAATLELQKQIPQAVKQSVTWAEVPIRLGAS